MFSSNLKLPPVRTFSPEAAQARFAAAPSSTLSNNTLKNVEVARETSLVSSAVKHPVQLQRPPVSKQQEVELFQQYNKKDFPQFSVNLIKPREYWVDLVRRYPEGEPGYPQTGVLYNKVYTKLRKDYPNFRQRITNITQHKEAQQAYIRKFYKTQIRGVYYDTKFKKVIIDFEEIVPHSPDLVAYIDKLFEAHGGIEFSDCEHAMTVFKHNGRYKFYDSNGPSDDPTYLKNRCNIIPHIQMLLPDGTNIEELDCPVQTTRGMCWGWSLLATTYPGDSMSELSRAIDNVRINNQIHLMQEAREITRDVILIAIYESFLENDQTKQLRALPEYLQNRAHYSLGGGHANQALWDRIKNRVQQGSKGGLPGQWSARKAQLLVQQYKEQGGKFTGKKDRNNSLSKWTRQNWRTKSGKPSLKTGERYLPAKAIKSLSSAEYARTTRKKREGMRQGKQFVRQPTSIRNKTRKFRRG